MSRSGPGISASARPLAEPPIFNYDWFQQHNNICSDTRLRRLFAKDYALGYQWRDTHTEWKLCEMYRQGCMDRTVSERTVESRAFYFKLSRDIMVDLREDGSEILEDALHRGVINHLGLWETRFLDEDGGTTMIQRLLKENKNIFSVWSNGFGVATNSCVPAFEKYGHLAAPELHATIANEFQQEESSSAFLESWEARFLDADGGTTLIQRLLKENEDIFNNWSTASGKAENSCLRAMQKYAHLATPEFFTTIATEFERRKRQLSKLEAEKWPTSTASLDATSLSQGADNSTLSPTTTRSQSPTMLTAVHGGDKRALRLRLWLGLLWLCRWSLLLLLWWCWCTLLRQLS